MSHFVTVPPRLAGLMRAAGCIKWQGNKRGNGYGRKWMNGKSVFGHRLVLESKIPGFLESGYLACHTCDNPSCINSDHLVPGTAPKNSLQMIERNRKTSRSQTIAGSSKLSIDQLWEIQLKYSNKFKLCGVVSGIALVFPIWLAILECLEVSLTTLKTE
ncbi:MAG: HNH endonuclease [Microcoleus vaginatus WJT46-NPBG5]|jgi:hypothetical protein|nr:HNH endonuclease [Microcoleus vaginatus WJT46-NPBG5]